MNIDFGNKFAINLLNDIIQIHCCCEESAEAVVKW